MTDACHNKTIVQAFVEAVNQQDWNRLDHLVDPAFIRHSRAAGEPQVRSREDLKEFLRREFETFPDAYEEIQLLLAEDDKVAARLSFTGTQTGPLGPFPASGRRSYPTISASSGCPEAGSWSPGRSGTTSPLWCSSGITSPAEAPESSRQPSPNAH